MHIFLANAESSQEDNLTLNRVAIFRSTGLHQQVVHLQKVPPSRILLFQRTATRTATSKVQQP